MRGSLFEIRVLLGRCALFGNDLLEGTLRAQVPDRSTSHEKEPAVAVVEVEHHLPTWPEDFRESGLLHSGVIGVFAYISEERVALGASIGGLEIVAELERMIEVEPDCLDDQLGERVERTIAPTAKSAANSSCSILKCYSWITISYRLSRRSEQPEAGVMRQQVLQV